MMASKQRRTSLTHIARAIALKIEIKQKRIFDGRRATLDGTALTSSQGAKNQCADKHFLL
jgi:hypothetical protein